MRYRAKVMLLALLAAGFPAAAAIWLALRRAPAAGWTVGASFAGSAAALVGLALLLRPIGALAARLRAAATAVGEVDRREPAIDEPSAMMADVARLGARLDTLNHRLANRHQVTGLQTREPFLAELRETADASATAVLGIVRFGDYDRLAAFDQGRADAALLAFADRLRASLQPSRRLAQVDRDCFAIWFAGVDQAQKATTELQAVAYVLSQDLEAGDLRIAPEIKVGAATFPDDAADPGALLTRAFAALGNAGKAPGKLAFFSSESAEAMRERFWIEQGLRHAVSREQLSLHYQPVVDLSAGRVAGMEALLRWNHPERGLVPPSQFIPVLEGSEVMNEVGLWVLNTACRQLRAWQDLGLADLKMAVNLSARQCRDPTLLSAVVRTLERHRLVPQTLELELTETATMEDADHTRRLFGDLRALGVGVAIDDFGAGYSSLSYLKNLPFSKLKIDREFVTDVHLRRDSQAICAALVELARGLEITVLAEGVETREEVEALRELGCSMFQGFHFARPMPAAMAATITDPAWLAQLSTPPSGAFTALHSKAVA